jgi:hypothetical protein
MNKIAFLGRGAAQPALPPILANDAYRLEQEKRSRLRAAKRVLEAELQATEAKLHALLTRDEAAEVDRVANALVNDVHIEEAETIEVLTARSADLRLRISAHRRADAIQAAKIADMRSVLSAEAARQLGDAHRVAVKRLVDAVLEVQDATAACEELRRCMMEAGYDVALPDLRSPLKFQPTVDLEHAQWMTRAAGYAK